MSTANKLNDPREEHQLRLEQLYDKNQLMPRVRRAFRECQSVPFAKAMRTAGIPEDFGFDLLAQIAVHRRANVPTMVGCLRRHCSGDQETADLLERAVRGNFVLYDQAEKLFVVVYEISPQLQAELDMFQFPLPMVVPPALIEDNLSTGYLTGKGSVILRDNHHDDDVCLDHLNRMNSTRLSINLDVAHAIQNRWRGLDKKHPDETMEDFRRRRKAFEKYDSVAKGVIGLLTREGNELYLTHRYDKRGRTYCMGFHITYQGTDWNKAVIEFADKEPVVE